MGHTSSDDFKEVRDPEGSNASRFANSVSMVQAAHVVALQHQGVVDETAAAAILRAIDSVSLGSQGNQTGVWQIVANVDDKVEAATPSEIAGASALGRTRNETIATALRMTWRADASQIASASLDLRSAALELAVAHTVTVLGAFADRKAAAPSTLAHFLGGFVGPLESTWSRLIQAIDAVNRSPLGSGLMVGEVFSADRSETASLLGFREPIANTLDASGQVEDIVQVLEAASSQAAVIRRLVNELLLWIRTDPTSFFIDERWESSPEPAHAAHNVSIRLEHLNSAALRASQMVNMAVEQLRAQPYGPIGVSWDTLAPAIDSALEAVSEVVTDATSAIREALIVNRAYLANRAGRLYSTASDLAAFLMEDQQINPAAAQRIAGLAVARLKEASLEAAQITPDIIDSAAVLVIGQELKVEMETLGRYIAPRRFLERRDVLGSPKSDRTREWLATVEQNLQAHRGIVAERTEAWTSALNSLNAILAESAETSEN